MAASAPIGQEKMRAVTMVSAKFDTLKSYVRFANYIHCLNEKIYLNLIPRFGTIGTMIGGWIKETRKIQKTNQTF